MELLRLPVQTRDSITFLEMIVYHNEGHQFVAPLSTGVGQRLQNFTQPVATTPPSNFHTKFH